MARLRDRAPKSLWCETAKTRRYREGTRSMRRCVYRKQLDLDFSYFNMDCHNMNTRRGEMLGRLAIAPLVAASMMCPLPAVGHDVWSNGAQVPAWVKKACCGPSEVHQLSADKVHALRDGYHVDGLATVIPYSRVQPSPDGAFWGFWNPDALNPVVFCFFAPTSMTAA